MTNNQLKSVQVAITTIATTLEATQVMPPGVVTAVGTVLSFLVGLVHPAPSRG